MGIQDREYMRRQPRKRNLRDVTKHIVFSLMITVILLAFMEVLNIIQLAIK